MLSPACHWLMPKLHVSDNGPSADRDAQRRNPAAQHFSDASGVRQGMPLQQQREFLAAEPAGMPRARSSVRAPPRRSPCRRRRGRARSLMLLEVVDVGHDRTQRRALAARRHGCAASSKKPRRLNMPVSESVTARRISSRCMLPKRSAARSRAYSSSAAGRIVEDVVGAVIERDRKPVVARRTTTSGSRRSAAGCRRPAGSPSTARGPRSIAAAAR